MGWAEGRWSPGAGREGDFRLYNFHRYGFRTLGGVGANAPLAVLAVLVLF
jgi:hypothetical protein